MNKKDEKSSQNGSSQINEAKNDLRSVAEKLISKEDLNVEKYGNLSIEETYKVIHDLKVHQIELEMQNEELERIQLELDNARARYYDIYDLAPVGYMIISEKGLILESNLTAAMMLGEGRGNLVNQRLSQYIYEEDQDTYYIHRKKLFETLNTEECELRIVKNDGTTIWVHMKAIVVSEEGIPVCRLIISDISTRKEIELALMESQRIAHVGTWTLNLATNEVVWSEELYRIFGFDSANSPPPYTEHMKLFTPESWSLLSNALEHTKTSGVPYELELETLKTDGSKGWMWVRGEVNKDSKGNIVSLWGAVQDISERKKTETELFHIAYHDHLTGLYNRRYFEEEIKRLDTNENLPISIIMCDINGLKLINDSFGHGSGDELLIKAAETIKKACREDDKICRTGGDEFVILLPKTDPEETMQIANRIRKFSLKQKVEKIELSISYGYDTKKAQEQSVIEIYVNAENNMYRHKLYARKSISSKTVDLIMNALFEKSKRESIHSIRVSNICQAIAIKMNFDESYVEKMGIAGIIHDIGNIGIDYNILNKGEKISADERCEVERHPEIGWRILSTTSEFLELAQFVLNHHERWDGSGYPSGLKAERIPLEARIIAVADAYEAMTRKESYRKERTKEQCINELKKFSGKHFDSQIVDVFVNQVLPFESNFTGGAGKGMTEKTLLAAVEKVVKA